MSLQKFKRKSGFSDEEWDRFMKIVREYISDPTNTVGLEGIRVHKDAWENWLDEFLDAQIKQFWGTLRGKKWVFIKDREVIRKLLRGVVILAAKRIRKPSQHRNRHKKSGGLKEDEDRESVKYEESSEEEDENKEEDDVLEDERQEDEDHKAKDNEDASPSRPFIHAVGTSPSTTHDSIGSSENIGAGEVLEVRENGIRGNDGEYTGSKERTDAEKTEEIKQRERDDSSFVNVLLYAAGTGPETKRFEQTSVEPTGDNSSITSKSHILQKGSTANVQVAELTIGTRRSKRKAAQAFGDNSYIPSHTQVLPQRRNANRKSAGEVGQKFYNLDLLAEQSVTTKRARIEPLPGILTRESLSLGTVIRRKDILANSRPGSSTSSTAEISAFTETDTSSSPTVPHPPLVFSTRLATPENPDITYKFVYTDDAPSLRTFLEKVHKRHNLREEQRISSFQVQIDNKKFVIILDEQEKHWDWGVILKLVKDSKGPIEVTLAIV